MPRYRSSIARQRWRRFSDDQAFAISDPDNPFSKFIRPGSSSDSFRLRNLRFEFGLRYANASGADASNHTAVQFRLVRATNDLSSTELEELQENDVRVLRRRNWIVPGGATTRIVDSVYRAVNVTDADSLIIVVQADRIQANHEVFGFVTLTYNFQQMFN